MSALTSIIAIALGGAAAAFERRLPGLGSTTRAGNRASRRRARRAGGRRGDRLRRRGRQPGPVDLRSDRRVPHSGTPDLSQNSSRFVVNLGSNRYDAWRVALSDAGDDPLRGDGGGGYQYSYLREAARAVAEPARRPQRRDGDRSPSSGSSASGSSSSRSWRPCSGVLRARRLGPSAAALRGDRARQRRLLVSPHLGRLVLALSGGHRAGPRACSARACAPAVRAQRASRGRSPLRIGIVVALVAARGERRAPVPLRSATSTTPTPSGAPTCQRAYERPRPRRSSLNRLSDRAAPRRGLDRPGGGDRERALAAFREADERSDRRSGRRTTCSPSCRRAPTPRAAREQIRDRARAQPARRARSRRSPTAGLAPAGARTAAGRAQREPISPRCRAIATACARVRAPELCLGVADVGLDRRRRELEPLGDLAVGRSLGEQREDLALASARARAPRAAPPAGPAPCRSLPPDRARTRPGGARAGSGRSP